MTGPLLMAFGGGVAGVLLALWTFRHDRPMRAYKWKLPPDVGQHSIIVVLASSVEDARAQLAAYAQSEAVKAQNGGEPLWSNWWRNMEPVEVFDPTRRAVLCWTEFSQG